jgi:hypothetical protein
LRYLTPAGDPADPLTRDAADRMGRVLWPDEQPPAGLCAGEARHAAELSEALASGDPERVRRALPAHREEGRKTETQFDMQPGKGSGADEGREAQVKHGGAGRARTDDRQIMSPLL